MKFIKKHLTKIIIIAVLVLYMLRFVLGVTGIPGPYFGRRHNISDTLTEPFFSLQTWTNLFTGADYPVWELGFSSDGQIHNS